MLDYFSLVRNIPNALTLVNLLSGFVGIVLLFNEQIGWVLVCCAICLIADVADGFAARLLKATSEIGLQLDSFADLVSFGLLPGCMIVYLWINGCSFDIGMPALVMSSLIPLGTAIRLAKFNLDTRERTAFYGLPSPSSAFFVFGILLMYYTDSQSLIPALCNQWVFAAISLALPAAMLSSIRLWSLKGLSQPGGWYILWGFLLLFSVFAYFFSALAIPLIVVTYLLIGLLNSAIRLY